MKMVYCYTMLFVGGFTNAMAGEPSAALEKLKDEAPGKWREYEKGASNLQGSFSITTIVKSAKSKINNHSYELRRRADCLSLLWQSPDRGYLAAVNPKYAFLLKRSKRTGRWAVASLTKDKDLIELAKQISRYPFTFATATGRYDFTVLDSGFVIGKAVWVKQGDKVKSVEVEFTHTSTDRYANLLKAGRVVFQPQRFWTISRYEIQLQFQTFILCTKENSNTFPPRTDFQF